MTTLRSLMDISLLNQMIDEGYIRKQHHPDDPDLIILNYTEKAAFNKVWNEATLQCRGLILRRAEGVEAVVVARPFPKFFNYGENGRADYDFTAEVEVTDKMDGSLGILYEGPDGPAIATRGSFSSDQALHATKVYRERYEGAWEPTLDRYTYLFEIIYAENRIVVDYGQKDDLIAIGAVRNCTGRTFGPATHTGYGWKGPSAGIFDHGGTLGEALAIKPREGAEGLVIRFLNTSEMVKLKQEDYVVLHRIIFGLNERAVWQRLLDGDHAPDINKDLPEEFHPWVNKVAERIMDEGFAIADQAVDEFESIMKIVDGPYYKDQDARARKKFFASLAIQSNTPGLLFLLYDDKSLHEAIFKMTYPAAVSYQKVAA